MRSEMKFINDLKSFIKDSDENAYLVGGFVREKLMNSNAEPKDIDVIYDGDMDNLLKYLNNKGYKFVKLEDIIEGVIEDDITVNVSKINGDSIEDDLKQRDYTINAICLKLIDNNIIDLFKGRKALQCRILQQVNEESIEQDPIRILRGIRFYIKHGMHFNLETENNIVENTSKLKECNKEELLYEIMKIIEIDKSGRAFELLDDYKILPELVPYIEELKNIGQCKYHVEDTFTHMNLTYSMFKDIVNGTINLNGLNLDLIQNKIGEFKIKEYVALAAFLHDIGKVEAYKKDKDTVSFSGHEEKGLEIVKDICTILGLQGESANLVQNIVKGHMYPLGLFKNGVEGKFEDINKFFDIYKENVPYVLIVSFCDIYATKMLSDPDNEKDKYKDFIEKILKEYKYYSKVNQ